MEFLKTAKRRSTWSYLLYALLNIGLAVALLLVIRYTSAIWLAFLIVLISKWRVLAVRPRYWLANIQANLVDLIVSVGLVVALYTGQTVVAVESHKLVFQVGMVLLYMLWLLLLKPQSKRVFIVAQSAVALLVGISALYVVAYDWIASAVVLFMWLIGYATARHVLSSYDESQVNLLSLAWGLVLAQVGWLFHHWTIAYKLPFIDGIMIPQVSIITLSIGFVAYKAYDSYYHHQRFRFADIILPLVFTICLIAVLLLAFNKMHTN